MPPINASTSPGKSERPKLPFRLDPPDPDRLQRLLVKIERPLIDAEVRARLLRLQQFYDEGHLVLLVTTITESEGNENALIEPIVSAVSDVMRRRPEWTERGGQWCEAFDKIPLLPLLQTFRDLDAFTDREIEHHLMIAVGRRVRRHLEQIDTPIARPEPNRISGARRAIEQGLELLKLKGPHSTSPISKVAKDRFGICSNECGPVMNAARLYGNRIWLVDKLSRNALLELSSRSSDGIRDAVDRRLRAGEIVRAPEIKRLRRGS
jgi:hypothetical protein